MRISPYTKVLPILVLALFFSQFSLKVFNRTVTAVNPQEVALKIFTEFVLLLKAKTVKNTLGNRKLACIFVEYF